MGQNCENKVIPAFVLRLIKKNYKYLLKIKDGKITILIK